MLIVPRAAPYGQWDWRRRRHMPLTLELERRLLLDDLAPVALGGRLILAVHLPAHDGR